MSILAKLQEARKTALKAKESVKATFLNYVISKAVMVGKNAVPPRDTSDAEIVGLIQKMIRDNQEEINLNQTDPARLKAQERSSSDTAVKLGENAILIEYLPQQLTGDELSGFIDGCIIAHKALGDTISIKLMGGIMKRLTEAYPGQFDKALASKLIKAALAA